MQQYLAGSDENRLPETFQVAFNTSISYYTEAISIPQPLIQQRHQQQHQRNQREPHILPLLGAH